LLALRAGVGLWDYLRRCEVAVDPADELARLDRDWERERDRYLITGRSGARYVPTVAASVVTGVVAAGFGFLWIAAAASLMNGLGPFPLLGLFFVALGLWVSVSSLRKAVRYRRAYEAYRRRREDLISHGRNEAGA
jgi:hypothetical protein